MNFKCTLRYLYMYVLSFFTGKFPMVTCYHYEHVHVLKAKTFQMIFRQFFNLVTIYFNGHSSYSTLTLFLLKCRKNCKNFEKLFYKLSVFYGNGRTSKALLLQRK